MVRRRFKFEDNNVAAVSVIMGSQSDWPTMRRACEMLEDLEIRFEVRIVSARRTPKWMVKFTEEAEPGGIKVIIAGAGGGAAHLPGMVASLTTLPVIGVPVESGSGNQVVNLGSMLSIQSMPAGVPVAAMAMGVHGAKNAALYAARILALEDFRLEKRLKNYIDTQQESVPIIPKDE